MNNKFILFVALFCLMVSTVFAIPQQNDLYHYFYKIESKGTSGIVLGLADRTPNMTLPELREHISMNYTYGRTNSQQWLIAPIYPGSNQFFIIHRETGYPLMVSGTEVKLNKSGVVEKNQRFRFYRVNGEYFQIQCVDQDGCFYRKRHEKKNVLGHTIGYYYSLCYTYNNSITNDHSYFKLSIAETIPGSENININNLVSNPSSLNNIAYPPQPQTYDELIEDGCSETIIGETWIPFCMVDDPSRGRLTQVNQTPFYKMTRTQAYYKEVTRNNTPGVKVTYGFTEKWGIKEGEVHQTQTTLEHSWTGGGTAQFMNEGKFLTLGTNYSTTLKSTTTQIDKYEIVTQYEKGEQSFIELESRGQIRYTLWYLNDIYTLQRMDLSQAINPLKISYSNFNAASIYSSVPVTISYNHSLNKTIIADEITPPVLNKFEENNHPKLWWGDIGATQYKLWRDDGYGWTVVYTGTFNQYIDTGIYIHGVGHDHCKYYVEAIVNSSSVLSNEVLYDNAIIKKENIENTRKELITNYELKSNYPNPFNPTTKISYQLPKAGNVSLKVYNTLGKEEATLVNEFQTKGKYSANFNAGSLASGIYYYTIKVNDFVETKKMLLMK